MLDECYEETKEAFFKYMQRKKGPYDITLSLILHVFDMNKWSDRPLNTAFEVKERFIKEFCTSKLQVPHDFNISVISTIDDNTNYMYTNIFEISKSPSNTILNVQRNVLLISDEKIAAMLRLVYGYALISDS